LDRALTGPRSGRLALTDRDRRILRACWSLGAAPAPVLHTLISPDVAAGTFRDRLRRLHQHGYLHQQGYAAPHGGLWLYSIGRNGLTPGEPRPWRPGLTQVQHTLDVASAIVALTRLGFGAPLEVQGWQGEAEIRAWASPGAPFPDALVRWRRDHSEGTWQVEVDRATETRKAWRRKLVRYLTDQTGDPILALTTTEARAVALARVAADVGVPLLATTLHACQISLDPVVLDTRARRRLPLSQT
jgi:hypothetical protein